MKRVVTTAILLAASPVALAAGPWDATFAFQVSAFRADANTTVRIDSNTGRPGTSFSLESDLGVDRTKTLPQIDFIWRASQHHGLEGSYVKLDRSGTRTINGEIVFRDTVYPVNTQVDSQFESEVWRLAYRYSFINDSGNELAVLLGAHYTNLKVGLNGQAGSVNESAAVDFPLPTIGLRGGWRFADNLRLAGFIQFLKLKVGDYDGSLVNASGGIEWAFHPNFYVGAGYVYYKYELDSEKDNVKGKFDYRFDGPVIYGAWAF
ncbi:hypothetical protein DSM104443_01941 [Usitatibacter rugosus]|uniref:Outer membrane protein with beta-barrel domain n=1 Tax=Usitatibacter rugosus TaxID=2732067 RepID=A0A6M4GU70_9PROT|nr:hypothetical protein [Usitatibacter rugosus]QJR10871.1 hypothetical protein DSM104443_01941 [Usitatibacter rugosus]